MPDYLVVCVFLLIWLISFIEDIELNKVFTLLVDTLMLLQRARRLKLLASLYLAVFN